MCEENEGPYYAPIKEMLGHAQRRDGWSPASYLCPLIKDPIAVFSAAWLASRFQTRNIVMIRHPAAFAGSLKEKRWTHPFSDFLRQPLLMEHHLRPFADDIASFARDERDVVDQAALLWNVIHSMILQYRDRFPGWLYVRHEDLSREPMEGFQFLFSQLGLSLSAETEQAIRMHSFPQAETFSQAPSAADDVTRNSLANIDTWRTRLTASEISRLRSQVCDISREFYSDEEW